MKRLSSLSFLDISWSAVLGWFVITLALDVLVVDIECLGDLVAESGLVVDTIVLLELLSLVMTIWTLTGSRAQCCPSLVTCR